MSPLWNYYVQKVVHIPLQKQRLMLLTKQFSLNYKLLSRFIIKETFLRQENYASYFFQQLKKMKINEINAYDLLRAYASIYRNSSKEQQNQIIQIRKRYINFLQSKNKKGNIEYILTNENEKYLNHFKVLMRQQQYDQIDEQILLNNKSNITNLKFYLENRHIYPSKIQDIQNFLIINLQNLNQDFIQKFIIQYQTQFNIQNLKIAFLKKFYSIQLLSISQIKLSKSDDHFNWIHNLINNTLHHYWARFNIHQMEIQINNLFNMITTYLMFNVNIDIYELMKFETNLRNLMSIMDSIQVQKEMAYFHNKNTKVQIYNTLKLCKQIINKKIEQYCDPNQIVQLYLYLLNNHNLNNWSKIIQKYNMIKESITKFVHLPVILIQVNQKQLNLLQIALEETKFTKILFKNWSRHLQKIPLMVLIKFYQNLMAAKSESNQQIKEIQKILNGREIKIDLITYLKWSDNLDNLSNVQLMNSELNGLITYLQQCNKNETKKLKKLSQQDRMNMVNLKKLFDKNSSIYNITRIEKSNENLMILTRKKNSYKFFSTKLFTPYIENLSQIKCQSNN